MAIRVLQAQELTVDEIGATVKVVNVTFTHDDLTVIGTLFGYDIHKAIHAPMAQTNVSLSIDGIGAPVTVSGRCRIELMDPKTPRAHEAVTQ